MTPEQMIESWRKYNNAKEKLADYMQEYAQQEAIAFTEWVNAEKYDRHPTHPDKWTRKLIGEKFKIKTTEELYNLYLKSKP